MVAILFGALLLASCGVIPGDCAQFLPPASSPVSASVGEWLLGGPEGRRPDEDPNIYKLHPDGSGKRYLTTGSRMKLGPTWSRDGKRIAFATPSEIGMQIHTADAEGTDDRALPIAGIAPDLCADGRHIVYMVPTQQQGLPGAEVWIADLDGRNQKQLTNTTVVATSRTGQRIIGSGAASCSPDGQRILYTSSQSGRNELWTMALDGSDQRQLTFPIDPTAPDANGSSWSPDGSKIAFFAGYETEYGNIYVMGADGRNRKRLSNCVDLGPQPARSANCDGPAWSPDGKSIIFQSDQSARGSGRVDRTSEVRTWIMDSADGNGLRIMFDPALNRGARPWIATTGSAVTFGATSRSGNDVR